MSLPRLPFDIYVHILVQLSVGQDRDLGSKTLARCLLTNSILRSAASLPALWEPHYKARYTHHDAAREAQRRESSACNWRLMYTERHRLDLRALRLLDAIMNQTQGRHAKARELTQTLCFDVWDVLQLEYRSPVPQIFRENDEDQDIAAVPHAVTRRFWANAMLGAISRCNALGVWGRLSSNSPGDPSLEETLLGLSAFFGVAPMEMSSSLDILSGECRAYLDEQRLALDQGHASYDLTLLCIKVCDFLRGKGFGAVDPQHFHDISNHFPHRFLSSHRHTIPLPLVGVFVSIARRLGIQASPVDFPVRVIAHVSSPDPEVSDIYVDVYGSESRPVLSARDDIPQMLLRAGVSPSSMLQHISPCSPAAMLLRSSRNILTSYRILSVDGAMTPPEADSQPAIYAALCANLLLTNDPRLCEPLLGYLSPFPLDAAAVLSDKLAPLLMPESQDVLKDACDAVVRENEESANHVQLRSLVGADIKYFVGMVFEHVRHGYLGCIIGWERTCMATERWIMQMRVDALSRGRHQPFYHVIALNGPQRYVAEDNIRPIKLDRMMALELFKGVPSFGMYFEDAELHEDEPGYGRMIMSRELRLRYPEDDRFADSWVSITEGTVQVDEDQY